MGQYRTAATHVLLPNGDT